MNFSFRNITLEELGNYIDSEEYKTSDFVPVSRIRAISHLNNPRANKTDCSLILAYDNTKLIGYIGALPDVLFDENNNYKVCWISCMWVLPEYRRHGIAFELIRKLYKVYDGNVWITNFIPRSKAAFNKTDYFEDYIYLKGIRAYVRFDLSHILSRKNNFFRHFSFVLQATDFLLNIPISLVLKLKQAKLHSYCTYREIDIFDEKLKVFIDGNVSNSSFRRGAAEFEWIKNYPWIKKVKRISTESAKYYFSQEGIDFQQWFLKVEDKGKIVGFLMVTLYRGELKTPYLIYEESYVNDIARIIARILCKEKGCTYISYNQKVNEQLKKLGLFLHVRKSEYGFLISKKLKEKLSNNLPKVFDGDGDGGFT